jgi:DNA-binding Xre family transcriptional regulator
VVQRHVASIRQSKKLEQKEAMRKHATLKMKRKPMEVYVQILTGRCITLSVSPDDNIQDVMEKIKAKEGINPDQQMLLFAGKKLSTDVTVDDYMIQANSKLFLTLRGLGG